MGLDARTSAIEIIKGITKVSVTPEEPGNSPLSISKGNIGKTTSSIPCRHDICTGGYLKPFPRCAVTWDGHLIDTLRL